MNRLPAQPPIARGEMTPIPWAGHPLLRPFLPKPPRKRRLLLDDPRPVKLRRFLLFALVVSCALIGSSYMVEILPQRGQTWLEQGLLLLFGLLFGWIAVGFWTGVMGAWVLLRGKARKGIVSDPDLHVDPGEGTTSNRTAIIMPICNEHVATVFAGLRATYESLRGTGRIAEFDFFVLSDTYKPDLRAAEQAAFSELQAALSAEGSASEGGHVYYRWRQVRSKRKAGNVADFCRRWGRDYRYMVVLDADSVMTGDCLTSLVDLMETHPDSGIIQTAPRACGHVTAHARALQFSSAVYGPLFTAGLHFWQLGESQYWGHNAILRIAPFMEHCALASLKGETSLSGDIMSHDFVEAALIRRAGWKVWIAHDLEGSFEQVPPSLLDEVQRDQRWCHGNLQNSRLMFEPGLHAVHRSVFFSGVLSYATAPLWLGFLLFSTLLFAQHAGDIPTYFAAPYQLFPTWPTTNLRLMLTLFGATAVLLLGPKVIALAVIVIKGQAGRFGGVGKLMISAVLEFFYTVLLAPVRMLFHTRWVVGPLMGLRSGWTSPPRNGDDTPWSEAIRRNGVHTLLAAAWVAAILVLGQSFPYWLSPVIAGLLLAAPLSVWGSWASTGMALRRAGLLLIPEEQSVPQVLSEARRYEQEALPDVGFVEAVVDDHVRGRIVESGLARGASRGEKGAAVQAVVARALAEGADALEPTEKLRLLGDFEALTQLGAGIGGESSHPTWTAARSDTRRGDAAVQGLDAAEQSAASDRKLELAA